MHQHPLFTSAPLGRLATAVTLLAASVIASSPTVARSAEGDACVTCHSDRKWLVQNKKLFDYFQDWQVSVHGQEGINCVACHGGNPKAGDKAAAHKGGSMDPARSGSAVNFRNIPKTCAECHDDIYQGYRQSRHAKHLDDPTSTQGPSCVTCHGSVNAAVLNVNTVKQTCSKCHNDTTHNHPEIPARASELLTRLLSIDRLYRYVSRKSDPKGAERFIRTTEPLRADLSRQWHTFELDTVDLKTRMLLDSLKKERDAMRATH
jgi:hypothetical protein